ncbi:MAG: ABC transporter permease [Actinobacteria bacterium]|nr:ABC transporter permease [Actinomycetota bacterium]
MPEGGRVATAEGAAAPAGAPEQATLGAPAGAGPWRLAWRRLRRNRATLVFGGVFVALVLFCIAAPLYAKHVAHTGPYENHLSDTIEQDGETVNVVGFDGVPIGPTWRGEFLLGADDNGRDVMVRILYGGRNSLLIGVSAALITLMLSILLGLVAGYMRGRVDGVISRMMDVLWAFPVVLLGVALGTSLALGGFELGPVSVGPGSLLIPIFVISIVYVPYMARPVRGQVLILREQDFVEAARSQGAGPLRVMFAEILPNLASTMIVFFPLLIANAILLEAALSFLGAGVQSPEPSWGTMIDSGVERIITAPMLTIAPGVFLVATVLALNVFGDGVRDAFDPKGRVRMEH